MTSQPDQLRAEKLYRYAVSLKREGLLEQALGAYDALVDLMPDSAEAHNNRGNLLDELGRFEEAVADFARAVELKPDYAEAHNNHGVAMMHMYRYDEALASYARALALKEDYAEAWSNRGNTLKELGRLDDALTSYDRALALKGDDRDAAFNKSLALLLAGRWAEGWPLYEWRWAQKSHAGKRRDFGRPLWLGQADLAGKTILLYGEQGLGDAIQFARYAPLVAARGARVILQVAPRLVTLMRSLTAIAEVIPSGAPLPKLDFHCPLLSLALAFGSTPASVPSSGAYLAAEPARIAAWAELLGTRTKPRIGLVWSSMSDFGDDAKRSIPFRDFVAALPAPGTCDLVSLQIDVKPGDRVDLAGRPDIRFFGPEQQTDFAETAALIENVDLVVSTCTSVPHLSGALGKPTWLLLSYVPDWRWMMTGTETPWYASLRLYRQRSLGDWTRVLGQVRDDLASGRLLP